MRSSQERELKQHSLNVNLFEQDIKSNLSQKRTISQSKDNTHRSSNHLLKQIRQHFQDKLKDQHKIAIDQLCQRLAVNPSLGLSSETAAFRRREEGPNLIPQSKDPTRSAKYLGVITNWFSIPLWISSVLLIISYCINSQSVTSLGLAIFIIFLILLTGLFSYTLKEEPRQNKFKSNIPPSCRVLRDGLASSIREEDVVRGDIVLLLTGCVIPADLRIFKSDELKVVNENITGCKQSLVRSANYTHQQFLQTQNLVFKNTLCVEGRGIGIVINTGTNTIAGYKAQLQRSTPKIKPFISYYLESLMKLLAFSTSIVIALSLIMMNTFELTLFGCLEVVSGIILANTPETLLICILLSKSATCRTLAYNKKVLVKGLRDLDGLSQISCVCLAKGDLINNYGQENNPSNSLLDIAKAVERCKVQGVKIVLFTRESQEAALAFGKQIGLITAKSNIEYQQQGIHSKQALQIARSNIVDGQLIKAKYQISEQQGDQFLDFICSKRQIIFTNVSTTQKLAIVKSCKRSGQTVSAWTEGYIDFILSAHSDVAITNGCSGSDISKEAADVILLDDNFASIVEGIALSKTHFKNIRKSIIYLLTSSMAELLPFLAVVFFQIPPPLSSTLTLYISLITDTYSGISLAFEQAENCISTRFIPENQLNISAMMIQSYGILGVLSFGAGFFTYNLIMNCYGIPFQIYYQLLSKTAYVPQAGISFNSYLGPPDTTFKLNTPYLGFVGSGGSSYYNGNCDTAAMKDHYGYPSWFTAANNRVDLRAVFVECCNNIAQNGYCPQFDWPDYSQTVQTISPISGVEVAYTTEALFYAQSGYFSTIVMVQWVNLFICKSRKTSIIYTTPNYHMFGSVLLSACFMVFVLYVPGVNWALGGRPLPFFMLAVPGTGFSSLMLLGAEIYKKMIKS